MKEEYEETWQEFYKNNRAIPCHVSRPVNDEVESCPFHLLLVSLDGVPVSQRVNVKNAEYQARVTFYDAANRCMFGSTWIGPLLRPSPENSASVTIPCNEPLYFHSSLNDYTVALVVEITVSDGNTYESCGWTLLRIFSGISSLSDTDDDRAPLQNRLQVFSGSPAALLLIPEPVEECPLLKKVDGCFVTYTLQSHSALADAFHLIPENIIISGDDIVPGVSETEATTSYGVVNILQQPVLLGKCPCFIDKLTIDFTPSVDAVETRLCHLLNEDRIMKCDLEPDGGVVSVIERKLLVGVHNGWCFLSAPHVVFLEKGYDGQRPRLLSPDSSKASPIRSPIRQCSQLTLKSRIGLEEMFYHPLCTIVFQLELLVSLPVIKPDFPTNKKAQAKLNSSLYGSMPLSQKEAIALRWCAWSPFHPNTRHEREVTLAWHGGPPAGENPFDVPTMSNMLSENVAKMLQDEVGCSNLKFSFASDKLIDDPTSKFQSLDGELEGQLYGQPSINADPSRRRTIPDPAQQQLSSKPPLPTGRGEVQPVGSRLQSSTSYASRLQEEISPLTEVPTYQPHTTIIAASPLDMRMTSTIDRASQAKLHSTGYPPLLDQHGNPPFLIDPTEDLRHDLQLEEQDPLNCNEITFQFLALSWCNHARVFFTFQFYRFPQFTTERTLLKDVSSSDTEAKPLPSVLQKCGKDGKPLPGQPGVQIKYSVDPSFMRFGERRSFLKYLLQQKMFIDVWDGDSLLLIGSAVVELKHLLRQGKSAIQVAHELDVISVDYSEDNVAVAGDWAHQNGLMAESSNISLEGKLFLRLGNAGSYHEINQQIQGLIPDVQATVIAPPRFRKTLESSVSVMQAPKTVRAKLMLEKDSDLATVLFTRRSQMPLVETANGSKEMDAIRQRKLKRMQEARDQLGSTEIKSGFTLQKEEKVQRIRDLKTIQFYRDKCKHEGIVSVLEESISTQHRVATSLGLAQFFEYALTNPLPTNQTIGIHFDDKDLSLITSREEWMHYKAVTNTRTALEENMFHITESSCEVFLKGFETLHIPFKYQTFTVPSQNSNVDNLSSRHPLSTVHGFSTAGSDQSSTKRIKVSFISREQRPIAIVLLDVDVLPHGVDQTFRFYNSEQSFLKRTIRLPPWQILAESNVVDGRNNHPSAVSARCSDDQVICEVRQSNADEPQDVFLKCPCGASPSVRRFFVVIFSDRYSTKPCLIWQILVASLQRIDLTMTVGQSSKASVILRGKLSSRMVQCHSSRPNDLQIIPGDQFMLMANAVQEIQLVANPSLKSNASVFVNVVDVEFHQLVKSWLVCISCKLPVISKTFEVSLQTGGGKGSSKKIGFTNPYPLKKSFYLSNDRPDLLQFKEDVLLLGSGESHNVGLRFLPHENAETVSVLVFINDKDGKNEETFCIKAIYSSQ